MWRKWLELLANTSFANQEAIQRQFGECCELMDMVGHRPPPQDKFSAMTEMLETCFPMAEAQRLRKWIVHCL